MHAQPLSTGRSGVESDVCAEARGHELLKCLLNRLGLEVLLEVSKDVKGMFVWQSFVRSSIFFAPDGRVSLLDFAHCVSLCQALISTNCGVFHSLPCLFLL